MISGADQFAVDDESSKLSAANSGRLGFRRGTPLAISSGLFGILYGAACVSVGISPWLAALSCVLVFSGAIQFAVISMLDEPLAIGAIAVSSLLICNRLVLMGASIADHIKSEPFILRLASMLVLTDGAWAATLAEKEKVDRFAFFVCAGIWILTLWVAGTLLGGTLASNIPGDFILALSFAGVLFLSLLLLLVVKNTRIGHAPWLISALTSLAVSQFVTLWLAFLAGVTTGALFAWFADTGYRSDDR
ncbi:MAG: AzlC family ABC transporter permease [Pseudomonadota bacterium]